MRCKDFASMKKIEILLLINLIMERFLKVALELLKQFFIMIMKLESSFIKFLLNQATIWHDKFPKIVTGQNALLGYLGAASGQRFGGSIYQTKSKSLGVFAKGV